MIFLRGWEPAGSFQLRAVIHHATLNNMDWNSLGTFFTFGVKHVLEGWDHLLFASALVLALRGFWEVFKVIGVFTLAHSITVSLTVVRGAPLLPEWFVEPCIAASIIFVALENIFLPGSAGSVRRLAVAFIFGLVHGMGLAGALLETLSDMSGAVVVWAVVLGVGLCTLVGLARAGDTSPSELSRSLADSFPERRQPPESALFGQKGAIPSL